MCGLPLSGDPYSVLFLGEIKLLVSDIWYFFFNIWFRKQVTCLMVRLKSQLSSKDQNSGCGGHSGQCFKHCVQAMRSGCGDSLRCEFLK